MRLKRVMAAGLAAVMVGTVVAAPCILSAGDSIVSIYVGIQTQTLVEDVSSEWDQVAKCSAGLSYPKICTEYKFEQMYQWSDFAGQYLPTQKVISSGVQTTGCGTAPTWTQTQDWGYFPAGRYLLRVVLQRSVHAYCDTVADYSDHRFSVTIPR
jgi:hypothetical protein